MVNDKSVFMNVAPHIINLSVSGNQAFRHRRSSMNSSTSGSGGDASRKTQLLTSLAILATFSEKGPGGKLALTPTVEMQTLVKLMTAASLKMLQLFMDVIEDCCDPKSKYYKMVTKSSAWNAVVPNASFTSLPKVELTRLTLYMPER